MQSDPSPLQGDPRFLTPVHGGVTLVRWGATLGP